MAVFLTIVCACLAVLGVLWWVSRRAKDRRVLEEHSITPEALQALLNSDEEILIYDVRQPLDMLVDSEIIPGAKRIAPKEILDNPSLIPKEREAIVYCTCISEKTSREILGRALALQFFRVKFLEGGLGAWKAKGYPVEPYTKPFHLDSAI
jgi:rhodanese-related sulfurtransferase